MRRLLVEYLRARRALCAAARHGDLERFQQSLDALGSAGIELAAALQALDEHRQRGSAFRHSVTAGPAAGNWLDCTT